MSTASFGRRASRGREGKKGLAGRVGGEHQCEVPLVGLRGELFVTRTK
jgi:hypothetical protein